MMTETHCILALDCADYSLVREWDCTNLLDCRHGPIETFSNATDQPYTPEIWASVAAGTHPDEHGVEDATWTSRPLRMASHVTRLLPYRWRGRLGDIMKSHGAGRDVPRVEDHLFEHGVVKWWPGVASAGNLIDAWTVSKAAQNGSLTEEALRQRLLGNAAAELGWLAEVAEHGPPIAGVHTHALDIAGHVHARDPESLRFWYDRLDTLVGELRDRVHRLTILSDHGIQTTALDDEEPGRHSRRAYIATSEGRDLPASVFEVREWASPSSISSPSARESDPVEMDTSREALQSLGYLE